MDIEEIKEEKNLVRRDILLQKYGFIPPKLTDYEQKLIGFEEAYGPGSVIEWIRFSSIGATV